MHQGEVLGSAFRFVISSLMGAELLLPTLRARVTAMRDDAWEPWPDYVAECRRVAALLADETVVQVGINVMSRARPLLEAQGFDTVEAAMTDWRAVFLANVRGLPKTELRRTLSVEPGKAVVSYPDALPAPLIEGFLRGCVAAYGRHVVGYTSKIESLDGSRRLRCEIAWRA